MNKLSDLVGHRHFGGPLFLFPALFSSQEVKRMAIAFDFAGHDLPITDLEDSCFLRWKKAGYLRKVFIFLGCR